MKKIVVLIVSGIATATLFAGLATCSAAVSLGDGNRDGVVMEDESGWNCHTMGNQVCG